MFKNSTNKGFINGFLAFLFTGLSNRKEFEVHLKNVAISHCKKGIKAAEYGVLGSVLFWTIESCLGHDKYTENISIAWIKIYSTVLAIVVPEAVKYELTVSIEEIRHRTLDHDFAYRYTQGDETARIIQAEQAVCPVLSK